MPTEEVDRARVEALSVKLTHAVDEELRAPYDRDNVFVSLNALAFAAATIIAGTCNDPAAQRFFDDALDANIQDIIEARRKTGDFSMG